MGIPCALDGTVGGMDTWDCSLGHGTVGRPMGIPCALDGTVGGMDRWDCSLGHGTVGLSMCTTT